MLAGLVGDHVFVSEPEDLEAPLFFNLGPRGDELKVPGNKVIDDQIDPGFFAKRLVIGAKVEWKKSALS